MPLNSLTNNRIYLFCYKIVFREMQFTLFKAIELTETDCLAGIAKVKSLQKIDLHIYGWLGLVAMTFKTGGVSDQELFQIARIS